jgi:hypothetical protein
MNILFLVSRARVSAMSLAASVGILGGCATAVRPVAVNDEHPASPHAASGTPAPADFPLLAPVSSNPESEAKPANADEDAPAPVHHHHDS